MTDPTRPAISLHRLRQRLSRHSLSVEEATSIAAQVAQLIGGQAPDEILDDAVSILGELTFCGSGPIEETATRILFRDLIEPLNDAFDPDRADLADRITAQLIAIHIRTDARLSSELRTVDIGTQLESLARRLRATRRIPAEQERLKRLFVLSRITVGADVAVTSVILSHLKSAFPGQEIVLVGPRKLRQLFGGDHRLLFQTVEFQRAALLRDRLAVWIPLQRALEAGVHALKDEEYLVVDPDSRMTQLGLLPPIARESNYVLFDSRRALCGSSKSLAEITGEWCAARWPIQGGRLALPYVAPVAEHPIGTGLRASIDGSGTRKVAFVSLGVGGNERKRLPSELEDLLIDQLAMRAALIIDSGATDDERSQVSRIAGRLRESGRRIEKATESTIGGQPLSECDVLLWDGGIGSFATLVSMSDGYVGYDSAGQHIAAALGKTVLTLFAKGETARFAERWRATGRGQTRTLHFNTHDDMNSIEFVDRAMSLFDELLGGTREPTGS